MKASSLSFSLSSGKIYYWNESLRLFSALVLTAVCRKMPPSLTSSSFLSFSALNASRHKMNCNRPFWRTPFLFFSSSSRICGVEGREGGDGGGGDDDLSSVIDVSGALAVRPLLGLLLGDAVGDLLSRWLWS